MYKILGTKGVKASAQNLLGGGLLLRVGLAILQQRGETWLSGRRGAKFERATEFFWGW